MDFGKRAFDNSYHIDPIVRSLMDTDFYKLLMLQFIWKKYYHTRVTFEVNNRTKSVKLAEIIDINELKAQFDYVRNLKFRESELVWLRGQTFYGQRGLFEEGFLDYLRTFSLPEYKIGYEETNGVKTGQFEISFSGTWPETTLWEIYALEIINELRYRKIMSSMKRSELDIMYARAKVKLHDKLASLNKLDNLQLTDFGTRRRHSFLWQEYCVLTAKEVLGEKFTGTSNAYLAMKHDLEAKGTNAHELPMAIAAMAKTDKELLESQYEVLRQWQNVYREGLLVMLPDTFGSTQFLENMNPIMARAWTGARPDSKEPIEAGEELISFWKRHDPGRVKEKLIIFSDGLDVHLPNHKPRGEDIAKIYNHFNGRVRVGFGFGTNFTNDFVWFDNETMKPISLVCKIKSADGKNAIKLSDVASKVSGNKEQIERYWRVFGNKGVRQNKEQLV